MDHFGVQIPHPQPHAIGAQSELERFVALAQFAAGLGAFVGQLTFGLDKGKPLLQFDGPQRGALINETPHNPSQERGDNEKDRQTHGFGGRSESEAKLRPGQEGIHEDDVNDGAGDAPVHAQKPGAEHDGGKGQQQRKGAKGLNEIRQGDGKDGDQAADEHANPLGKPLDCSEKRALDLHG